MDEESDGGSRGRRRARARERDARVPAERRESPSESRETREREVSRGFPMGFLLFQMTPDKKLFPNAILGLYFN